jgi:hypothetical protein
MMDAVFSFIANEAIRVYDEDVRLIDSVDETSRTCQDAVNSGGIESHRLRLAN